jgi:DNA primase
MKQSDKQKVIHILDSALGIGSHLPSNERAFHCPFCHHHKKKLSVNLTTQKYQCWVCGAKGRSIPSLLRRLDVRIGDIQFVRGIYGDSDTHISSNEEEEVVKLYLPKEFISFNKKPKSVDPIYSQALKYTFNRGIGWDIIQKYNIGYCQSGLYAGRIIIPSYDKYDELNWFEARTFYDNVTLRYMKPPVSRNVIVFESHINWNEPITLVEGVYDAFSIRRNVIPLLGKGLPPILKDKIFTEGVKEINIMMDNDAVDQSIRFSHYFIQNGITVKNIIPPKDVDFGDMGFRKSIELLKTSPVSHWDTLILDKLATI